MAGRWRLRPGWRAGELIGDRAIAAALGLTPPEAAFVLGRARTRLGARSFWSRRAAFAVATSPLGRVAVPRRVRRRLIGALLVHTLAGPADAMGYVTLCALAPRPEPPRGLLRGSP